MPSRSDSSDHTELVLASGTNFLYQCETQYVLACTVPLLKESVLMYGVKLVPELPSLLLILLSFLRSHQSRGGYHPPLHPPAGQVPEVAEPVHLHS